MKRLNYKFPNNSIIYTPLNDLITYFPGIIVLLIQNTSVKVLVTNKPETNILKTRNKKAIIAPTGATVNVVALLPKTCGKVDDRSLRDFGWLREDVYQKNSTNGR